MIAADAVDDDEVLYRRVPQGRGWLEHNERGDCVWTSAAFSDRNNETSVDRAARVNSPVDSQEEATDGVLILIASGVRAMDAGGGRKADVFAAPPPPEHAQIRLDPRSASNEHFKKLKERLKRIARGWAITPTGECT